MSIALGLPTGPAASQEAPAPGLSLADVLQTTLASNPEIQLARQQAEGARGVLTAAGAPFDLQFLADGAAGRLHRPDPRDGASAIQKDVSYSVGVQRLFRNGISVVPDVALTRTSFSTWPGAATSNVASVALTVNVPLLRDRGGVVSAASERAAAYEHQSSLLLLQHTTAYRTLTAAVSYWDYLTAQRRLEVFRSSEERAQRIADQTRTLVEAEERTAADLTQTLGNLAAKRVARLSAEQVLVEARQQLGLAVGLQAYDIAQLPAPATGFPALAGTAAARTPPPQLLEQAYARRTDLLAAEQDLRSAEAILSGSRSELRPRLDLVVGTGYNAAQSGLGLGDFFSPLFRRGPRLDGSFQFSYQAPMANARARGRLLQNTSSYEQQRVVRDDLRRRIASGVWVAAEALFRSEAGMRESEEAARLLESTVQAEQRKFQLGVSTLFDVIQAQDGLTNALLGQIGSQRNYAVAIATLRFQSGTLLGGDRERPSVNVASLGTPP